MVIGMKQKLIFLLGLLLVVVTVIVIFGVFVSNKPKFGELRVESQPAGSVFLETKHLGRTPYKDKVAVGEYTIKVVPDESAAQYASWEARVEVGQNTLT